MTFSELELPMNTVWILVCDAAKGRFFEVRGLDSSWRVLEVLTHEESRSKSRDLVGDRSGQRSSEGASAHHNALAPASSPKQVEKGRFIHTLATRLDQAMRAKRFDRWVLVAPPRVAGMLKKELTNELEKHLMATVLEDLNHLSEQELATRLRESVRIPLGQREVPRQGGSHSR
jgi:protein required for attachment to host cells